MDILHLEYFVAIVQNSLNLSRAAERLHISQPALSQFLNQFEKDENVLLFNRKSGRLVSLTPAGERLYTNALGIIENHRTMLQELRDFSSDFKGSIKIGIPPLVLSLLFTEVMTQLIISNPSIDFIIIEKGAFELRNMLLLGELDLAVLICPHNLNSSLFQEVNLYEDELSAFMNINHPLTKKEKLKWSDIKREGLVIFNETFMVNHHLMEKFKNVKINPKIIVKSSSWDFQTEIVKKSNFITILPSPIKSSFMMQKTAEVKFYDPIPWRVVVLYEKKDYYPILHNYLLECFIKYFLDGLAIEPFKHMDYYLNKKYKSQ